MTTNSGLRRTLRSPLLVIVVAGCSIAASAVLAVAVTTNRAPAGSLPRAESEVPVTSMDQTLGPANNSPVFAADPTEPLFVVLANRVDAPDFDCGLQVSGDGGRSWLSARPVRRLPAGVDKCYGPEVGFDRDGLLYYLFVGLAGAGNEPVGVFLTSSDDQGRTFSAPRAILGPLNFGVRMAIDPTFGDHGRIHLVWLSATSDPPLGGFGPPPNPLLAAHSDDGGRTFSQPVQVNDPERKLVVGPTLTLGPDRAVHIAYYDLGDDLRDYQGLVGPIWSEKWSVVIASSFDGGLRFDPGIVADDSIVPHERVTLIFTMPPPALVSDREGRLCIAWTDARHGDADALFRCSNDEGQSWEDLRRLNDDALGNGLAQYLPHLSVGPHGRLDAIFYDRRDDPENVFSDTYYTYSTDGGRSFAPNLKLTQDPSDSRIGQQYVNPSAEGQVEFGSRLALLSRSTEVIAAWTDTRNSRFFTTGQDIFVTTVHVSTSNTRLLSAVPVRAALMVGVLLLVVTAVTRVRRRRSLFEL